MNHLSKALSEQGYWAKFLVIGAMDGVRHDALAPWINSNLNWSGVMVEPVKEHFERLCQNFGDRQNIKFENSAITESSGTRIIRTIPSDVKGLPEWVDGISTLVDHHMTIDQWPEYYRKELVNCLSFADLCKKYALNDVDIVQIDCEGYDYNVFNQIWDYGTRPNVFHIEIVFFTEGQLWEVTRKLMVGGYAVSMTSQDLCAVWPKG